MISCVICLEILAKDQDIWCTTCGHIFHNNCLTDWLMNNNSCPQCRKETPQKHKVFMNFVEDSAVAASNSANNNNSNNTNNSNSNNNENSTNPNEEASGEDLETFIMNLSLEERVKELERELSNCRLELDQYQALQEQIQQEQTTSESPTPVSVPFFSASPSNAYFLDASDSESEIFDNSRIFYDDETEQYIVL